MNNHNFGETKQERSDSPTSVTSSREAELQLKNIWGNDTNWPPYILSAVYRVGQKPVSMRVVAVVEDSELQYSNLLRHE